MKKKKIKSKKRKKQQWRAKHIINCLQLSGTIKPEVKSCNVNDPLMCIVRLFGVTKAL